MHLFCLFPHGVCSLFSLAWELSGAPWSSLIFFPPLRTWLLKYTVTVFWVKTKPVWFGLMDIETRQISYSSICISLHPTGCGCSASSLWWEDDFLRAGKENMEAPFLPAIQERLLPTPLLACTGTCWSELQLLGPWWLVTSWSGCLLPDCLFCLWGTPCRSSPPYPQAPPRVPDIISLPSRLWPQLSHVPSAISDCGGFFLLSLLFPLLTHTRHLILTYTC